MTRYTIRLSESMSRDEILYKHCTDSESPSKQPGCVFNLKNIPDVIDVT